MKKLLLAVLFSVFAFTATAGGKDDVVMEQPAEPVMVEEEVEAPDNSNLAILGLLLALVLAAAAGS